MIKLSLIAAYDENKGVGFEQSLPWHIPEDLKHFKSITSGKNIIMGKKTFESLPKLLPNRTHIVLTSDKDYQNNNPEIICCSSIEECLSLLPTLPCSEHVVIGGSQIWKAFIPYVDTLFLTEIKGSYKVDTYFPDFDENLYKKELIDKTDNCLFYRLTKL